MDINLFNKIKKLVEEKKGEKEELIILIKEKTGIEIKEEQLEIKGKKVILYLNSNQRMIFNKRNGEVIIKEKGFSL